MEKKTISIMTPCYNEQDNIELVYEAVKRVMNALPQYNYEHLFIDNKSTDRSRAILRKIAQEDSHVSVILNRANFGAARSSTYGLFQTRGNASITLACDMQDPPDLIPLLLDPWEKGAKVVWGQKTSAQESGVMYHVRTLFYKVIAQFAEGDTYNNVTGFGLYDEQVVRDLCTMNNPTPIFRYDVLELGYTPELIEYDQPKRAHGKSSYTLRSYIDLSLESLSQTSFAPLRIITYVGTLTSTLSFCACIVVLICSVCGMLSWMSVAIAVGIFLISCCILSCGMLGEYMKRVVAKEYQMPLVYEEGRINSHGGYSGGADKVGN